MQRKVRHSRRALAALLLCATLSPAAHALSSPSPDAAYEKAVQMNQADEPVSAIIELKNALKADPKHLPSLVLAAEIYLEQTLGRAAELSLREALEAGGDRNLLLPMLGEALLQQGKWARLLGELNADGLAPESAASVLARRAQAHMGLGDDNRAREELDRALALAPQGLVPRVVEAAWFMRNGDEAPAFAKLDVLVKDFSSSSSAWALYAAIYHARGDFTRALEGYGHALETNPRNLDARIARIGILMDLKRDAETKADFERIEKDAPGEPRAAYLAAVLAGRTGDQAAVRKHLDRVLERLAPVDEKLLLENPTLLLIRGLAHYDLRNYEAAIGSLTPYVKRMPRDVGARKALGDAILHVGGGDAVAVLEPIASLAPRDARGMTLLATAYAAAGQGEKATQVLERMKGDARAVGNARTKLAMLNIGAGRVEQGLSELEASVSADPSDAQGALALVVTQLNTGRTAAAVDTARKLLATAPTNAVYENLLGVALYQDGKLDLAGRAFGNVLAREPEFRPAAINLGKLEVRQGKFDAARARFKALQGGSTDDAKVLLEMSRLELAAGDERSGTKLAEQAAKAPDAGLDALFHLLDLRLAKGELEQALDLALRASSGGENSFDVQQRLAMVQIRMRRLDDARATLKRMSQLAGYDIGQQIRTAALQAEIGAFADADYALFKALQSEPKNLAARRAQVELSLRKGAWQEALQRADAVLADTPDFAPALVMRGHARLKLGQRDAALADYDSANRLVPSSAATLGGYRALRNAGRAAEARQRLANWLDTHPDDTEARLAHAEDFMLEDDYAGARKAYAKVVEIVGRAPEVLNNYAVACLQDGARDQALALAREAHGLAPQDPAVLDTLGWILGLGGEHEEALGYLRDAVTRRSGDAEIRFHLAWVLDKLGRRKEALAELDSALGNRQPFAARAEAEALRASLAGAAR